MGEPMSEVESIAKLLPLPGGLPPAAERRGGAAHVAVLSVSGKVHLLSSGGEPIGRAKRVLRAESQRTPDALLLDGGRILACGSFGEAGEDNVVSCVVADIA